MPDNQQTPIRHSGIRALPRKKQILIVVVIASIIVAALGVGRLTSRWSDAQATHAQKEQPTTPGAFRPTKAQWANLKIASVNAMAFYSEQITDGNIASNDDTTTPVFSPYSGRVTRVIAKLGDVVKKGTPLFAIEATEFVQGQNDVITASAALTTAQAQLRLAQAIEQRQRELFTAKAAARKDWEQSESDLTAAQNNLRAAEIAFASARNRLAILGKTNEEINALAIAANAQRANPEVIVRAPINGTVIQRQIGVGQYISSQASGGTTPVFTISDMTTVWLIANVREADAPLMRVGQPIEIHVAAFPGHIFKSKLAWVAPAIDPLTHRLPVRATLENLDGALKPMMFANFSIQSSGALSVPSIPESAVIYEGERARAWVARDDGTVLLRVIRVGRHHEGMIEVTDGLRAGERIVASGTLFIDRAAQGD